ncbi:MAG: hypothetical protein QM737_11615 [Ferruginibacter sp.]
MALLLLPVFYSCTTYNMSMEKYYSAVESHDYDKAIRKLNNSKIINRSRNQLLYCLEAGKMYRLKNDFTTSNNYLNQADNLIESSRKSAGDVIVGNLLNPMQQAYRGEDFEQFMVHFYKALNYSALGQTDEAVVEARRITLAVNAQSDKFRNKDKRYSTDAFALNLQGMIYEMAGDMNNAFISYRNAADVYMKSANDYYGVKMPEQLKKDLLKTATAMGFSSEAGQYEKLFNISYKEDSTQNGELILFLEEGRAPVKEERNFVLTSAGGTVGNFIFVDQDGNNANIPFNYNSYGISESKLSSVRTVRVAMPVYRVAYPQQRSTTVSINGNVYAPQLAENINSLAVNVLKERFLVEITNALARQLTKKLLEKGTQAAAQGIAKNQEKKADDNATEAEKEKKRKQNEDNAKAAGEIAGFLVNVANTITEKADTRNWQSLPAFVSYVRIPLAAGENTISINVNGGSKTIKVTGRKGLQMTSELLD